MKAEAETLGHHLRKEVENLNIFIIFQISTFPLERNI
jgi:hypothetical protein